MLTAACFALATAISTQAPVRQPYLSTHDVPWSKTGHPLNGRYKLYWDDKVDGQANTTKEKSCDIKIQVLGDDVLGEFIGPIAGQDRKASLVGRVEGGSDPTNLLTFRQREEGYTCSYHLVLGMGSFAGTWYDTKGRSGDFLLLKYQ